MTTWFKKLLGNAMTAALDLEMPQRQHAAI